MLVYDGDCGFCTKCVNAVEARLESPDSVFVIPWQWLDLDRYGLTERDMSTAAYWIDEQGRLYRGHRAVAHALRHVHGPVWRMVVALLSVPPLSWLAAALYWLIARYRHKLPGATPTCRRPG